jgi:hypothetical protein
MLTAGIIAAYLLIGLCLGRRVFVAALGDSKRIRDRNTYSSYTYWTSEYTTAFWWTLLAIPFWPVIFPVRLVFADTPHEKTVKRQAELKRLSDEVGALEKKYDLKFNSEK